MSSAGVETNASSRGKFICRLQYKGEECQRGRDRQHVEEGTGPRTGHSDQRRHPHVFAALESDDCAKHRQPQEENAGKFVRPDEGLLEKIARGDAAKQNDDFCNHQERRGGRDDRAKALLGVSQSARQPG